MLSMQYGDYVFPIMPKFTVTISPAHNLHIPEAYRKTFKISGELFRDDWSITSDFLKGKRQELEAAFRQQQHLRVVETGPPVVVIDALWNNLAIGGLVVEGPHIPEDPTGYATHLPFEITVYGDFKRTLVDSVPAGLGPPADPADNAFGEYQIREELRNGDRLLSVTGTVRAGTSALVDSEVAAIQATVGGSLQLLAKQVMKTYANPATGGAFKVGSEFSFEFIDLSASPEIYDWEESIELRPGIQPAIVRPILGGGYPVVQVGALTAARITQTGSCKGRTGYPPYPLKRFIAIEAEEPVLAKGSPIRNPDGVGFQAYPIRWQYSGVSATGITPGVVAPPAVIVPSPGAPPG